MDFLDVFLKQYGTTFGMMVLVGLVVALLIEFTIKKSFSWLEKKLEGKDKALSIVATIKAFLIQLAAWVLIVWFLNLLLGALPFPGSRALYPIWLCLEYVIQFVFSCAGFKGIQSWYSERKNRKPEPKEILTPTSVKGLYRNTEGVLVNSKGVAVEVL